MKAPILILVLFLNYTVTAQECSYLSSMDPGDHWTMTSYSSKGKKEGKTDYIVKTRNTINDTLILGLKTTVHTKKSDSMTMDYEMTCHDGTLYINMERMIGPIMENMEGMDFELEADEMSIPEKISVGDSLAPASVHMKAGMNGMTIMNITVSVVDRKVTATDTITTPAGTFSCFIIEQTVETQMGRRTITINTKDWFSTTYGTIRTESYKKGKLKEYTELTEIEL